MSRYFLCAILFFCSMPGVFASVNAAEKKEAEQYHVRGYDFQLQGDLRQAQFYYERALPMNPADAGLLNDMGLVYEGLGQVDLAEEYYLKAIAADMKCLAAYSNLGYLYAARGNYDLAVRYFEDRVRYGRPADPRTLQAQEQLSALTGSTSIQRKKIAALEEKQLINDVMLQKRETVPLKSRDKSVNAAVEYQRGIVFFEARRFEAARSAFEDCLRDDPGHKAAQHMLERINMQEAAPKGEAAPRDEGSIIAAAEYDKGLKALREGRRDQALAAFDRALAFTPADADILAARAKAAGN
jgi:tetratricopeptide (TPR) repeat protein